MRLTDSDLGELLRESQKEGRSACLPASTLTALAADELTLDARNLALDHLSGCHDCIEELRLAGQIRTWAETTATERSNVTPLPRQRRVWPWAVAASMTVPLIALSFWQWTVIQRLGSRSDVVTVTRVVERPSDAQTRRIAALEQLNRTLSAPQINVPIIDLLPDAVRGEAVPQQIDVPADSSRFNLILTIDDTRNENGYMVTINDASGRSVWSSAGLKKSPYGTFTISLPAEMFPQGRYAVSISGVSSSGRKRLVQKLEMSIRYR